MGLINTDAKALGNIGKKYKSSLQISADAYQDANLQIKECEKRVRKSVLFSKLHSKQHGIWSCYYTWYTQNLWNAILENDVFVFLQSLVCHINCFLPAMVNPETRQWALLMAD